MLNKNTLLETSWMVQGYQLTAFRNQIVNICDTSTVLLLSIRWQNLRIHHILYLILLILLMLHEVLLLVILRRRVGKLGLSEILVKVDGVILRHFLID